MWLPIFLAVEKVINPFFPDYSQILYMRIPMIWFQEVQFVTGFKVVALPAAFNTFLLATLPHLTEGRAAASFTGFLAAEFYQGSQYFIALRVVFKYFKE